MQKEIFNFKPELKKLTAKEYKEWYNRCYVTATYPHRHYIEDNEYIPFDTDIEAFLNKEIDKINSETVYVRFTIRKQ